MPKKKKTKCVVDKYMRRRVRDVVTGLTGTVTGFCHYITGCDQAAVTPPAKEDGTYNGPAWLDISRLQFLDGGKAVVEFPEGSDKSDPKNQAGGPPAGPVESTSTRRG